MVFALANMENWKILVEKRCANIGATFIALSVLRLDFFLSYVALGAPV